MDPLQDMAPVWQNASKAWDDLNQNRSASANDSLKTIDDNPTTTVAPTTTTTTTTGRDDGQIRVMIWVTFNVYSSHIEALADKLGVIINHRSKDNWIYDPS